MKNMEKSGISSKPIKEEDILKQSVILV